MIGLRQVAAIAAVLGRTDLLESADNPQSGCQSRARLFSGRSSRLGGCRGAASSSPNRYRRRPDACLTRLLRFRRKHPRANVCMGGTRKSRLAVYRTLVQVCDLQPMPATRHPRPLFPARAWASTSEQRSPSAPRSCRSFSAKHLRRADLPGDPAGSAIPPQPCPPPPRS